MQYSGIRKSGANFRSFASIVDSLGKGIIGLTVKQSIFNFDVSFFWSGTAFDSAGEVLFTLTPDSKGLYFYPLVSGYDVSKTNFKIHTEATKTTIGDILDVAEEMVLIDTELLAAISTVLGTPAGASIAADIAANLTAIQSIQNNTNFSSSPPSPIVIPDTGDIIFKISCGIFDNLGNPEDPDSQDGGFQVAILGRATNGQVNKTAFFNDEAGSTGATASVAYSTYLKMVRTSVGRFETYYKLPAGESIDSWTFTYKYAENTVEFIRERGISIIEQDITSVTLGDTDANKKVIVNALRENIPGVTTVPETSSVQQELDAQILTRATAVQILSTALTEAYSTKGSAATVTELLYEVIAELREFNFTGTIKSVKKLDGVAVAYTNQTDNATTPTEMNRAT